MRNNSEKRFFCKSEETAKNFVRQAVKKRERKFFLPLAAGLMLLFSALLLSSCGQKSNESTESPEGGGPKQDGQCGQCL